MAAACTCPPELLVKAGHPPFPTEPYNVQPAASGTQPAVHAQICGLPCGCMDVSALTSLNMPANDIRETVKRYVKRAILKEQGQVPTGRAGVTRLLEALQSAREASEEEEDSSSGKSSTSSSDESSSDEEDSSEEDKTANKHASVGTPSPQQTKRQKTGGASPSSDVPTPVQAASASTPPMAASEWLASVVNICTSHIWLHASPGNNLEQQVFEVVTGKETDIKAYLRATLQFSKQQFVVNCTRSDIIAESTARKMMDTAKDEYILNPLYANTCKMVANKVLAAIEAKRALWSK